MKPLNARPDKFAFQWLNVLPCNNLNQKLFNQQLRVSTGLRIGAKICEPNVSVCRKQVEELGLHGLPCLMSAGRLSRHARLNHLIEQTVDSIRGPSLLDPKNVHKTDNQPPDRLTLANKAIRMVLLLETLVPLLRMPNSETSIIIGV